MRGFESLTDAQITQARFSHFDTTKVEILDPVAAGKDNAMDSSRPPTVAEIEARNTQRARDHGYDSWEEYEDAREQREQEAYIKQIEERRKRGESDLRPIACTNLPVFEEPVPEPWYLPEKCHCKGMLRRVSFEARRF